MQRSRVSLVLGSLAISTCLAAHADTTKIEGTGVIAAASINPPNPVEGCNKAKQDAEDKAVKAGTKGLVSWDQLSVDSDCRLTTKTAGSAGTYFIFTAIGNFTT